jgi:hypothetical protein
MDLGARQTRQAHIKCTLHRSKHAMDDILAPELFLDVTKSMPENADASLLGLPEPGGCRGAGWLAPPSLD